MDWDRTRPWVIERREIGRGRIRLHFETLPITLRQLAAIRRVCPGFTNARPEEIRARISTSGDLDIGEYGYIEARSIERAALDAGLPALFTNTTRTQTVIVDEDGRTEWHIEDEHEHERLVLAMVAAGVRVVDVAID